jgi:hypothetical protein
MKMKTGDMVRLKANRTMWIVLETMTHLGAPERYVVVLRHANNKISGRAGTRIDYPEYYELVCRPHSSKKINSLL